MTQERARDVKEYDALIVVTPADYQRVESQYGRLLQWMPVRRLLFIGSEDVGRLVAQSGLGDRVGFVDENSLIPFSAVHGVMQKALAYKYGEQLPRGITGWYYQQFLKMQYAYVCQDEYYMVWDGDTIPCGPFSMFKEGTEAPYLDLKTEYHAPYFVTLEKLFPGMRKCIQKSFIAEHMLMNVAVMRNLIREISNNTELTGDTFWEKIISAVGPETLLDTGFSEFETYGTYVAYRFPTMYKLRDWHSFRYGGEFFELEQLSDEDLAWLGKDFYAISFEKSHFVREDHKNLFNNKEYQKKMSARQMLEVAQQEFGEGSYQELWDDSVKQIILEASACEEKGDLAGMFYSIRKGLALEYNNYELYYMLGYYYLQKNVNQAALCFENALFYCNNPEDRTVIEQDYRNLQSMEGYNVKKAAILIANYEGLYLLQKNIECIRGSAPSEAYRILIVDNGSSEEVVQWIATQEDITLIANTENLGFAKACNQAAAKAGELCPEGCDLFLLNNDTRLAPNALFWLRMGLYEDDLVGATGSISNYAGNRQQVEVEFKLPAEYLDYGRSNNLPMDNPYEERVRLSGFAMLIRNGLWEQVGGMDEIFTPGYFEDDDLCMKIQRAGYRLLVCLNSFIYHAGSQSFAKRDDLEALLLGHHKLFIQKYGFDILEYAYPNADIFKKLTLDGNTTAHILEIGCGLCSNLKLLQRFYPGATIVGVESNPGMFDIASRVNPVFPSLRAMGGAYAKPVFDVIILHQKNGALSACDQFVLEQIRRENSVTIYV